MPYRGRHRVARPQSRLRAATVVAVTTGALIAPVAFSGPVSSQAVTGAAAVDTLANHPEWLLSASDPVVARQIGDLKRVLTDHGQTYDTITAYRVPTTDGFVTYVTTAPQTMTVQRNPGLIERTPDGAAVLDLDTVLARLLDADGEGAGPGGGVDIPSIYLINEAMADVGDTIDDVVVPSLRWLTYTIQNLVESAVGDPDVLIGQLQATVNAAIVSTQTLAAELLQDALEILGTLPTSDELVQAVLDAAGPAVESVTALQQAVLAAVEALDLLGQLDELVRQVPTDPHALIAQVQALVEQLTAPLPPIDPLTLLLEVQRIATQQADALLTAAGLPPVDELDPAALVYEVVPLATASLPVNSGSTVTDPLAHPVAEPVDAGAGVVPEVQAVYEQPDEDKPQWNRNNDDCYLAESNAWWRYNCWNIDNQIYDDSSDSTYWQFNLEASSYPKQKRGMLSLWVEGVPRDGNATQKFDGNLPEPNQEVGGTEGCASSTDSISFAGGKPVQLGLSYSYSITTCETYTPRGYSDQGHWANKWNRNPARDEYGVGYGQNGTHMRNVAFTMGVKTKATDGGVGWMLLTGTRTTKKYCC